MERHYGIRHHGPGSARAVLRALDEQRPDLVLIEGPPEADELVGWAANDGLVPPVALLGYLTDSPGTAAYWPFAVFSPEWQAIRWAVTHDVPVRFFDLPWAYRAAAEADRQAAAGVPVPGPDVAPDSAFGQDQTADPSPRPAALPGQESAVTPGHEPAAVALGADPTAVAEQDAAAAAGGAGGADEPGEDGEPVRPVDPIGELAAAAGYDDPERWWEDVIEHRGMPAFEAIAEAMAAIRAEAPEDPEDLVREAHMRTVLRAARRTHENIAVVCGAWHVPALASKAKASDDAALLKGRKKAKVTFTWVPWTYGRLVSWQGYGAGVRSPGWYDHLFTTDDEVITRWLVRAAGVLRDDGVPVSSAHVIESVRLAEALAVLRGRPLAGLAEVTEAARAVLCEGDELRLDLIGRRLVVSERLGEVPDDMPAVPLARDLVAQQRTLRLKPSALESELKLDLRKETDLGRSRLLHRLRLLGVPWGEPDERGGGKGTFRESWRLRWQPEYAVSLVEASGYGTTVLSAATARVVEQARQSTVLAEVTALVEVCLPADLPDAYPPVLRALDTRAALDSDVTHLMAAIPALARTLRYGDVRGTDLGALGTVTTALLGRVCAGLPSAVLSLSDEAADDLRRHADAVHAAVGLLDDAGQRDRWLDTLSSLTGRDDLHGLLAGRFTRVLYEADRLDRAETRRRMGLVLTAGVTPAAAARWIEGFLSGGGLLLVHDAALLALVDEWLAGIAGDAFTEALPLLRRTFGTFAQPERRSIGERVAGQASAAGPGEQRARGVDHELAGLALPTLGALLGREIGYERSTA